MAASSGKFKGKIKIYNRDKKFTKDDILVAEATSPEMCVEMLSSGAVVTQFGGILSHAAIFCRELKKPCVVGVSNLFEFVKEGNIAEVDGDKGIIKILDDK